MKISQQDVDRISVSRKKHNKQERLRKIIEKIERAKMKKIDINFGGKNTEKEVNSD